MAEKEYIEREALIKACKKIIHDRWNETTAPVSWSHAYADFIDDIKEQPTADVAPVRHGRWVIIEILCGGGKERKYYRCSECNKANVIRSNYCGNCGARMDGDKND